MNGVYFILALTLGVANAKKELKLTDCGGSNSLITVHSITDTKNSQGPVTFESVLKAMYTSRFHLDNHEHYKNAHVDLKIKIKRWLGFWYLGIPSSFMNKVLHSLEDDETHINKDNNMLEMKCEYEHCLPRAGNHMKVIRMKDILSDSRKFAKILHLFGSGWYNIGVEGWTDQHEKVFCFNVEMKTQF